MSISNTITINYNKLVVIENGLHKYRTNIIDYKSYFNVNCVLFLYTSSGYWAIELIDSIIL